MTKPIKRKIKRNIVNEIYFSTRPSIDCNSLNSRKKFRHFLRSRIEVVNLFKDEYTFNNLNLSDFLVPF